MAFGASLPRWLRLASPALVNRRILTFVFLLVILGATHNQRSAPSPACRLVFSLTLIHLNQ